MAKRSPKKKPQVKRLLQAVRVKDTTDLCATLQMVTSSEGKAPTGQRRAKKSKLTKLSLDEFSELTERMKNGDEKALSWALNNTKVLDRTVGELMEFNPAKMRKLVRAVPGEVLAQEVDGLMSGMLHRAEHDGVMAPNLIELASITMTEVSRRLRGGA